MTERSPKVSPAEHVAAQFVTATQTFALATRFTGRVPLPPIGEVESLIKPERSAFVQALLGAYPTIESGAMRLMIGEPSIAPLCQTAEQRFVKAVQSGAVRVGIDPETNSPKFVLKYVGKLVALCIEDFRLPNGQRAIKDNWYAPVDVKTTQELENEFDAGGQSHFALSQGSWALMRPLMLDNLRTLATVRKGDPVEDFMRLISSDEFTRLLQRSVIPAELTDFDGLRLSPDNLRRRKENFESIYENTDLLREAYENVIATD